MYPAGVAGVGVRYVRVGDLVTLRLLESGPSAGPPVLLLHGWGASAYMHRFALQELPKAGFRAIAVDLRGHGLSDKPIHANGLYRTETLLTDVALLLDALGLERVAVVGQSMGGGVAMRLALELPDRVAALGLVSPVGISGVPIARVVRALSLHVLDRFAAFLVPRWLVAHLLRMTYGDPSRVSERDIDEYWAPSQFDDYYRAMRALVREFDWEPLPTERLRSLRVPTMLIVGTQDRLIPGLSRGTRRLPQARVMVVERGGHDVNEEFHEAVDRELVHFLATELLP